MNNKHFLTFSIVTILVLLASAVMPVTVLADDGTTPPPTEQPVVEAPVTEEPVTVPDAPVTEESVTVPEILESAPEGTEVVVVSESGEVLPLGSEAAAQVLVEGDPMWCPTGTLPGDPACTSAFKSFTGEEGLLTELEVNSALYSGAGTIYIAHDYNAVTAGDTGGIYFFYDDLALTDLTLQGGWDFDQNKTVGTSTLALGAGYFLGFYDWGSHSLQLKDINVTSVDAEAPAGGLGVIDSSADVTLDHVAVTDTVYGIYLPTDGDATLRNVTATGNLTGVLAGNFNEDASININIENSTFDKNGYGIYTFGNVDLTVTDSQANQNDYVGIYTSIEKGNVTLDGVTLNENKAYGVSLRVFNGNVTLDGVTANENTGYGAYLYVPNGNIDIRGGTYNQNKVNLDYEIPGHGIEATAKNVTLTNVTAQGNETSGAVLSSDTLTKIVCGQYTDNTIYGLAVDSGGNTDVYGADLSGNGDGEIDTYAGTTTLFAHDCNPQSAQNAQGNEGGEAVQPLYAVFPQEKEKLPNATLPDGFTYSSALQVVIYSGAHTLDIPITLSFPVPADKKDANMVILWWTGTEWTELANAAANGRIVFDTGHLNGDIFQGQVNFNGFFVLAYK